MARGSSAARGGGGRLLPSGSSHGLNLYQEYKTRVNNIREQKQSTLRKLGKRLTETSSSFDLTPLPIHQSRQTSDCKQYDIIMSLISDSLKGSI